MSASADVGLSMSPYPGLRPFRRNEADIFFGREEQIDQLLAKLAQCRFLSVVGTSGCGKSSLVRAGMLAGLEGGFMASAGPRWHVAEMRPGSQPLANLAHALLDCGLFGEQWSAHDQGRAFLLATLRRGPLGLVEALGEAGMPPRTNLLLLVDQFEEIFRFHKHGDSNEATAFVDLLLTTAKSQQVPVYVVVTMRSDFLGDCSFFIGLPEAINDGQFLTPRLSRDQCRAAIVGPAAVFNCEVEPGLVNRVLNDMGTDPDQLPLMQHAMMRVWMRAESGGGSDPRGDDDTTLLTAADYDAIGGLRDALSNHADEAYDELDVDGKRIAEIPFRCLSERGGDQRDIRRPVRLATIAATAEVAPERVAETAEYFRRADCSFLTPPAGTPLAPEMVLDISHESLIRQWKQLARWVGEEADSGAIYRRLSETARLWSAGRAAVWGTPDLENALAWRQREHLTAAWAERYGGEFELSMRFLDASLAARDQQRRNDELRQQRELELLQQMAETQKQRADEADERRHEQQAANGRLRRRAVVAFLSGAAAVVLAAVAFVLFVNARAAQDTAEEARRDAVAERTKAESERNRAEVQRNRAETFAKQEGEASRLAQKSADSEAQARECAEASKRQALEKTLDAYDSLAHAAVAQSRWLVAAQQPGRQAAAVQVLEKAGSSYRESQELMESLADDPEGGQATAARWLREHLPKLRTEAFRWLTMAASLQPIKFLTYPNEQFIVPVALSPDGNLLVRCAADQLLLIDPITVTVKNTVERHALFTPRALAFSPDGSQVLICSLRFIDQGNSARTIIQVETLSFPELKEMGTKRMEPDEHHEFDRWGGPDRFVINADLRYLIASTAKGTTVWEIETGRRIYYDATFRASSANHSGSMILGPSPTNGVRFVEMATGRTIRDLPLNKKVTRAWIGPDERVLAVEIFEKARSRHLLEIIDAKNGKSQSDPIEIKVNYSYDDANPAPLTLAFHRDGKRLVVGDEQRMYLISLPDGDVLFYRPHYDPADQGRASSQSNYYPENMAFSASGGTIVSCLGMRESYPWTQRIFFWDSTDARIPAPHVQLSGQVNSVRFLASGAFVAGSRDGGLQAELAGGTRAWTTTSRVHEASYFGPGARLHGGFEPSGKYFVQFLPKRRLVWETATGRLVAQAESSMPGNEEALPGNKDLRWLLVKQIDADGGDAIGILHTDAPERASRIVARLRDYGNAAPRIRIGADGRFLAFVSTQRQQDSGYSLQVIDTANGRVVAESPAFPNHRAACCVNFASEASQAVVHVFAKPQPTTFVEKKDALHLFDLANPGPPKELANLDVYVPVVAPNGKAAVFQQPDRSTYPPTINLDVWWFDRPAVTRLGSGVEQLESSPAPQFGADGTRLVVVHSRKKEAEREYFAELWDTTTATKLREMSGLAPPIVFLGASSSTVGVSFQRTKTTAPRSELWRLDTGDVLRSCDDAISRLSPDSNHLLLSQGTVIDTTTGVPCFDAQDSSNYSVFSEDGKSLATLGGEGSLRLWNLEKRTGFALGTPSSGMTFFSPDGKWLATSHDKQLQIWDTASGELSHEIPIASASDVEGPGTPAIDALEFTKDARFIAFTSRGQTRLASLETDQVHASLPRANHLQSVNSVSVSPDDRVVASASDDQTVCFWDAATGRFLGMLEGNFGAQRRVVFLDDGLHLLTRGGDGQCVLWRWALKNAGDELVVECTAVWNQTGAAGGAAAGAPGGATIALGDAEGTVRVLETQSGKLLHLLKPTEKAKEVRAVAFSPDGDHLAVAGDDDVIALWKLTAEEPLRQWKTGAGATNALAFSPDGAALVSAGDNVQFWDARRGELLLAADSHTLRVLDVAFDRGGQWVATASEDKTVAAINVPALIAELDKLGLGWETPSPNRLVRQRENPSGALEDAKLWRVASAAEAAEFAQLAANRSGASQCEQAKDWAGALANLDPVVAADPENTALLYRRGTAHAQLAHWQEAERDFQAAALRKPDDISFPYNHALALLGAGNMSDYRSACAQLQERFANGEDFNAGAWAIWASVLCPDAISDETSLLKTAESAVETFATAANHHENLAAVLYRAGRYDDALPHFERALRLRGGDEGEAFDWLLLAMCHQRQQKTEPARQALKKATEWIDDANQGTIQIGTRRVAPKSYTWDRRLAMATLRREAEELILGPKNDPAAP